MLLNLQAFEEVAKKNLELFQIRKK